MQTHTRHGGASIHPGPAAIVVPRTMTEEADAAQEPSGTTAIIRTACCGRRRAAVGACSGVGCGRVCVWFGWGSGRVRWERGPCDCGWWSSVVAAKLRPVNRKPERTAPDEAAGTTKALTAEASSTAAIRRRLLRRLGLLLRMVERLSDCNCELLARLE